MCAQKLITPAMALFDFDSACFCLAVCEQLHVGCEQQ